MSCQDYFSQWEAIDIPPALWQNEPNEQQHPGRRRVFELVRESGSRSVLEVACGIGVDYPYYQDAGIAYMGVDITPKFIGEAQRRGVPSKVADARNLPFKTGSYDTVYCKDLFIHLPPGEWRNVLKEMARVARMQVIVLDDAWIGRTAYRPCEKYHSPKGVLTFYNNQYGEADVREYADQLGLAVTVLPGGSVKRVHIEGNTVTPDVNHPSQITVYRKEK